MIDVPKAMNIYFDQIDWERIREVYVYPYTKVTHNPCSSRCLRIYREMLSVEDFNDTRINE